MTPNDSLEAILSNLHGKRVEMSSHFTEPGIIEDYEVESEDDALVKVATSDGQSKEIYISLDDIQDIVESMGEAIAP